MLAYLTRAGRRLALAAGAAILAASAADAQARPRDRDRDDDEGTVVDTTFAFAADGSVDLTLVSGSITVTGWTRGEARVRATSEYGRVDRELSRARIVLETRGRRGRMGDTRYELSIPAGARVVAHTVSGDVTIRAIDGEVEAHTTSGELLVANLGGRVTLESVSGDVSVSGVKGDVGIEAVSGEVEVRDVAGEVEAESVSGRVRLRDLRSRGVRAETVSGEIEFQGALAPAGRYDFDAHSGDVRLVLPADASAEVSVETFSGSIDSDFPMTVQPTERRRAGEEKRTEFTIGKGGARVRVETFSGAVIIDRGAAR